MTNQAPKVIECPCGVVLRGSSDDETVANAQRHAKENHDMTLSGRTSDVNGETCVAQLNRVSPIVRE